MVAVALAFGRLHLDDLPPAGHQIGQHLGRLVRQRARLNAGGLGKMSDHHRIDWIGLNLNYINHGVARFREVEWAYGKRVASGAMVGYWQSMEPDAMLTEIN